MKNNKELPRNPLEITIQMLDCRWSVLIIQELLAGAKRFSQIKKDVKGITQKVLTSKLRQLEENGILTRSVISQTPLRVEYSLTDVGLSLNTVISAMTEWGKDYKKYTKLLKR